MVTQRRIGLALGLSLAAHALFVTLFLFLPGGASKVRSGASRRASGPDLCIRVQGWEAPRPRRAPRRAEEAREHEISVDVTPTLAGAPVLAPVEGSAPGVGREGGRAKSGDGGGGLLSAPGTVRRVVYVVDRSISMGLSEGLERARAELAVALKQLPPDAFFQVLVYNRVAEPLLPRGLSGLALADPDTVAQAIRKLDDVTASGPTDHVGALRAGLRLRPEVLFLVTDEPSDANELTDAHVRAVTMMNQGGAAIHVVELARRRADGEGPLTRLARLNRGTYRRVAPRP